MSSDKIFLVEILLLKTKLHLPPDVLNTDNLNFQFSFADIFSFDLSLSQLGAKGTDNSIRYNLGKSLLFPCPNKYLKQKLKEQPLDIILVVNEEPKGSTSIQWKSEFADMVKFSETIGIVKSVASKTTEELKNEVGQTISQVDLFIRMSCLGKNVQTPFTVTDVGKGKEYAIKTKGGSRTFKFEFTENSCEAIPVGPLYELVGKTKGGSSTRELYLKPLIDSTVSPRPSPYQGIGDFKEFFLHNNQSENDIVSICFRPSENKFFDFLNMISADVSTQEKATCVTIANDTSSEKNNKEDNILKKIKQNACRSTLCPASIKLKTYGLGPLATNSGLGTLDKGLEVPVSYGLSHVYGSLENYGPYAMFSKPKNINESYNAISSERILRLKGGGDESIAPKSPLLECKSIIEEVDVILNQYKNSLGPCGKASCLQAKNITENTCLNTCDELGTTQNNNDCCDVSSCIYNQPTSPNMAGCRSANCPYKKHKKGLIEEDAQFEMSLLPPAISGNCGFPKCNVDFESDLPPIHWDCPEPLPKDACKNPQCPFLYKDLQKLNSKKIVEPCMRNLLCPYALALTCDFPLCPFNLQTCPFKKSNTTISEVPTSKNESACCFESNRQGNSPDTNRESGDSIHMDKNTSGENEENCGEPNCPYAKPAFHVNKSFNSGVRNNNCENVNAAEEKYISNNVLPANVGKGLKKKVKRGRFVYSVGDKYPGVQIGHKQCVMPSINVPHKMGWLWNVHTPILNLKPRRGWRPGAVNKLIATRIKSCRQSKNLTLFKEPVFRKGGEMTDEAYSHVLPKPTLQLQKQQGSFWITMNPLKDPTKLCENENPYMECSPMTLKITKNKNLATEEEKMCYCNEEESVGEQSSESELDIEFTPPAGIVHPDLFKKKKNVIHCDSQYNPEDFEKQRNVNGKKGKNKDKKPKKKGKK